MSYSWIALLLWYLVTYIVMYKVSILCYIVEEWERRKEKSGVYAYLQTGMTIFISMKKYTHNTAILISAVAHMVMAAIYNLLCTQLVFSALSEQSAFFEGDPNLHSRRMCIICSPAVLGCCGFLSTLFIAHRSMKRCPSSYCPHHVVATQFPPEEQDQPSN